jgi:hypothetical protein
MSAEHRASNGELLEARLEAELSRAQADLEHKLAELKETLTDRFGEVVGRVQRRLRWLRRNRVWLAAGASLALAALVVLRRRARRSHRPLLLLR